MIRAEHEIHIPIFCVQLLAALLRDAACDPDRHILAQPLQPSVLAKRRVHLVDGLLTDGARVDNDELRVLRAVGRNPSPVLELSVHLPAVVHVHLAAEGLEEDPRFRRTFYHPTVLVVRRR